jgi:hypothetical protein
MTFAETLNAKVADSELSFPLVTHMSFSDARFGSYEILKSGRGADTHIFGKHSSGYSCFNTATCGVQRIAVKRNRIRA